MTKLIKAKIKTIRFRSQCHAVLIASLRYYEVMQISPSTDDPRNGLAKGLITQPFFLLPSLSQLIGAQVTYCPVTTVSLDRSSPGLQR